MDEEAARNHRRKKAEQKVKEDAEPKATANALHKAPEEVEQLQG